MTRRNKKANKHQEWSDDEESTTQSKHNPEIDKSTKINDDKIRVLEDKIRVLEDLLMKLGPHLKNLQLKVQNEDDPESPWKSLYQDLIDDLVELELFDQNPRDILIGFSRAYLKKYTKDHSKSKKQLREEGKTTE